MLNATAAGPAPDAAPRRELRFERLRRLARRPAPRVASGTPIAAAVEVMQAQGDDVLLVLDGERLVGVLTERDILRKVLARGVEPDALVDGFMTPDPETLSGDATLEDALELLVRTGYRSVALVDSGGRLDGVVRERDILALVAEAFPEAILNLPPRPHQVAATAEGG